MERSNIRTLIWVALFSIAMGYLESAVVVYLRQIYYPAGFEFPLKAIENNIGLTEIFRELATIIMLLGIGILAGKTRVQRFAYFIYSFAFWDIFYYVFLKALLGWPNSLLEWDILFLIPVTWVGPVLAPVFCSLVMIALAILIINYDEKVGKAKLFGLEWLMLILGSLVIIVSFTIDYVQFAMQHFSFLELFSYAKMDEIMQLSEEYIPVNFYWSLFLSGLLIILVGIGKYVFRQNVRYIEVKNSNLIEA